MNYSSILLLFTLLSFFLNELVLLPFLLMFSTLGQLKLKLSSVNLLYLFTVLFCIAISFFNNFLDFDFILGIHLVLVFIFTIFIRDKGFSIQALLRIVKIFLIFNMILIVVDVMQLNLTLSFTSHSIPRFKSIFLEPSVASFAFILGGILLFNYDKKLSIWILISLFFILITFSGGAYAILLILVLFSIRFKLTKKSLIRIAIVVLIATPSMLFFAQTQGFEKLVSKRIERVQKGGDNSSKLRFLAPLQVAEFTLSNSPVWGFGLGTSEKIISKNRENFSYFKHFDGTPTTKINNGYAIMLIAGGLSLLFVHIIFTISLHKFINRKSMHLYIMFIVFPVFSGHYVNIVMWTIAYLIIHLRSTEYQSHNPKVGPLQGN